MCAVHLLPTSLPYRHSLADPKEEFGKSVRRYFRNMPQTVLPPQRTSISQPPQPAAAELEANIQTTPLRYNRLVSLDLQLNTSLSSSNCTPSLLHQSQSHRPARCHILHTQTRGAPSLHYIWCCIHFTTSTCSLTREREGLPLFIFIPSLCVPLLSCLLLSTSPIH